MIIIILDATYSPFEEIDYGDMDYEDMDSLPPGVKNAVSVVHLTDQWTPPNNTRSISIKKKSGILGLMNNKEFIQIMYMSSVMMLSANALLYLVLYRAE